MRSPISREARSSPRHPPRASLVGVDDGARLKRPARTAASRSASPSRQASPSAEAMRRAAAAAQFRQACDRNGEGSDERPQRLDFRDSDQDGRRAWASRSKKRRKIEAHCGRGPEAAASPGSGDGSSARAARGPLDGGDDALDALAMTRVGHAFPAAAMAPWEERTVRHVPRSSQPRDDETSGDGRRRWRRSAHIDLRLVLSARSRTPSQSRGRPARQWHRRS